MHQMPVDGTIAETFDLHTAQIKINLQMTLLSIAYLQALMLKWISATANNWRAQASS